MAKGALAHQQVIASIWGHLENRPPSLDDDGHLRTCAPPPAFQIERDFWALAGISGAEDFFEAWERWDFSWKALFLEEEVREVRLKVDPKILKASLLKEGEALFRSRLRGPARAFEQEGDNEEPTTYICNLRDSQGNMCLQEFESRGGLLAHQSRSVGGEHGKLNPLFSTVLTNVCPWCRTSFSSKDRARQHVRTAWLTNRSRLNRAAFDWDLIIPKSLQCPMCESDFDTLAEYHDHAVECHLPPPPLVVQPR
eukprot:2399212-Pyramimonas_sp.AAC.1